MLFNLETEERDGYLVEKKYKCIWAIEIDIMKEIIRICEKYNLSYFAYGGTLIGAVRHKGFIPWDDDMDIAMLREDYEIFIEKAEKELNKDTYCLQKGEQFGEIYEGFSRIRHNHSTAVIKRDRDKECNHGIFIDIYPLDKLSDKNWKRKLQFSLIKNLSGFIYYHVYDDVNLQHKYVKKLAEKIKCEKFWKWITAFVKNICMMSNNSDSKLVGILSCAPYDEKCYWYFEDVKETIDLPYEDIMIKVPIGYDRSLRIGYGDYMEFPPVNERGMWHQNIYYDPFKPYTEYKNKMELFK